MRKNYPIQTFGGIHKDRSAHEIPLNYAQDASGMWPVRGRIERMWGKQKHAATLLDGAGVLAQYLFVDGAGIKYPIAVSTTKAYSFDSSAYSSIQDGTDFTTSIDDQVAMCNHFDGTGSEILVISNLKDSMRKWSGSGAISTLSGASHKSKLLLPFRGYLLCGYVDESGTVDPRKVIYSAMYNGESFPAANYFLLKTTTDPLVSMRLISDRAVLYKDNSISMLDYVGGGLIFELVENYKNGLGPVSHAAVVEWGRRGERHYFLSQDCNIVVFDGIDDANISDLVGGVMENITPSAKHKIAGVPIPHENKIIWSIPIGGGDDCSDLLIYDVKAGSWWFKYDEPVAVRSFGNASVQTSYTWDTLPYPTWEDWSDSGGWDSRSIQANAPEILVGGEDGYVRKLVAGVDDDGAALASYYFYPFDNLDGRDDTEKIVSRVLVEVSNAGSGAIELRVYTDNNVDDAAELNEDGDAYQSIDLFCDDSGRRFIVVSLDVAVMGFNFAAKLSSSGVVWSGRVVGFDFEVVSDEA